MVVLFVMSWRRHSLKMLTVILGTSHTIKFLILSLNKLLHLFKESGIFLFTSLSNSWILMAKKPLKD